MFPCFAPLFDGGVMELSAAVEPFDENELLRFGWIQPILEGASESSYNHVSHDALLSLKGRLGQKPRIVSAIVGFVFYSLLFHSGQEVGF
jgi:hypothetical protein